MVKYRGIFLKNKLKLYLTIIKKTLKVCNPSQGLAIYIADVIKKQTPYTPSLYLNIKLNLIFLIINEFNPNISTLKIIMMLLSKKKELVFRQR